MEKTIDMPFNYKIEELDKLRQEIKDLMSIEMLEKNLYLNKSINSSELKVINFKQRQDVIIQHLIDLIRHNYTYLKLLSNVEAVHYICMNYVDVIFGLIDKLKIEKNSHDTKILVMFVSFLADCMKRNIGLINHDSKVKDDIFNYITAIYLPLSSQNKIVIHLNNRHFLLIYSWI